jgi:hypothetical protein
MTKECRKNISVNIKAKPHSMTNIANTNSIFQKLVVLSALNYELFKKDSLLIKSSKERIDAKQQQFSQFH